MTNEVAIWDKVLKTVVNTPFIAVDRKEFLKKELSGKMTNSEIDDIINYNATIPKKIRDRVANGCIRYQLTVACSLSAVAGIPGGLGMVVAIPADVAQFYAQIFILIQKMLYLYGWEDLRNNDGQLSDETLHILTVWVAVMMGSAAAIDALNAVLKGLAGQVIKRIPRIAFGHAAWYVAVRQAAKWIGINITKKGVANAAGKVVPLIGAPISAGITYFTFNPMARKLKKQLDSYTSWESI